MKPTESDLDIDLKNPRLMLEFLLFYWFETWEKLIQAEAFVSAREHRRSRRRSATISNFLDSFEYLQRQLDGPILKTALKLDRGEIVDLNDFASTLIHLRHIQEALLNLHRKLDLLTGKGENQITYDFIRKLAADTSGNLPQEKSWMRSMPSIALTDDYNFIEYDLRNILSVEIQKAGLDGLPLESRETVLALPKAECDNPLMWAILAHELAHAMISWYKIKDQILERSSGYKDKDKAQKQSYQNWITEICADLIALRLLGPSYFFSFISMGFLLKPLPLRADHPSFIDRVGTMEKVLRVKFSDWSIPVPDFSNSNLSKVNMFTTAEHDLITFFFVQAQYYHELRVQLSKGAYRLEFLPEVEDSTKKMNLPADTDLILDVLERVRVPTASLASPASLVNLHTKLAEGQPASSEPNKIDKIEFQKQLNSASTSQDIYKILPDPETPYTLSSLLAGGWMLKIYTNYNDLWSEIKKQGSIFQTKEYFTKVLMRRNELLQSSLSRAFMMQMYWRWKDKI